MDDLLAALRRGDEAVFRQVVTDWSPAMRRVARLHVSTDASADEVVQDTWLAVLRGLPGVTRPESLRSWVFAVLLNTARSRGVREQRVLVGLDEAGPTVAPDRFRGDGELWPGHWTSTGKPDPWAADPVQGVLHGELLAVVDRALAALPERQRQVVQLRDVEGFTAEEVRELLELTPENQRVLLHRGRAKVRAALDDHYRTAVTA